MSTVVRVEISDVTSENPRAGKKLVIENQFDHITAQKRIECTAEELGIIEPGKPSSAAISSILANGNIRFGVCNIGDTNRFEIVPARGAELEFKMGSKLRKITHVVFYCFPDSGNIKLVEFGDVF